MWTHVGARMCAFGSRGLGVSIFPWGRMTDTREKESPLIILRPEGRGQISYPVELGSHVLTLVGIPFWPTGSRHEDSRPKLELLFVTRQSEANARTWEHGLQKGSRVLQKAQEGSQKGR
ncbi:hypothetical protein CRG98_008799 [Punica granatum]|uniref:Uncharacterized protein n=1 Tax=Punica granatum TaxID=22663 RepID=A0A2I0KQN3_PUNGR|nr:hypothetical protein CRG98_008799 [Punica granatum]